MPYCIPRPHCLLVLALLAFTSTPTLAVGLNDTGQARCYDDTGMSYVCGNDDSAYPRQDGRYGRDAAQASGALTKIGGGDAGFDYTKLGGGYGQVLPIQNQAWTFDGSGYDSGNEAAGSQWSCVKDNVSGLIWEVKTHASVPDLRDRDWAYTWYDANMSTNGGNAGLPDPGVLETHTCADVGHCDTAHYIADVNAVALCSYVDWRLPNLHELFSLTHKGNGGIIPAIEPNYFPYMQRFQSTFWSASTLAADSASAWMIYFYPDGRPWPPYKSSHQYVRLVSSGVNRVLVPM